MDPAATPDFQQWHLLLRAARQAAISLGNTYGLDVSIENLGTRSMIAYWRRCGIGRTECFFCRALPGRRLTVLQPIRFGGSHNRKNYVPACDACDDWLDRQTPAGRRQILFVFRLEHGLLAPGSRHGSKARTQSIKHPRTEAEWDAWERDRERRAR